MRYTHLQRWATSALSIALLGGTLACDDAQNDTPCEEPCNKGPEDSGVAEAFLAAWISDEGEERVLREESPIDLLVALGEPSESAPARLAEIYPELLAACTATHLSIHNPDGTQRWHFTRSRSADNADCQTLVRGHGQHSDDLGELLACSFQEGADDVPALTGLTGYPLDIRANSSEDFRAWLDDKCEPVPEATRQRHPVDALCSSNRYLPFVCELGLVCAPYELTGEPASYGKCAACPDDDAACASSALDYALSGPYHHSAGSQESDDWVAELYQILYADAANPIPWRQYLERAMNQGVPRYLEWGDESSDRVVLFRGRVPEGSALTSILGTALYTSVDGDTATWRCESFELGDVVFDDDGAPVSIAALADALSADCVEDSDIGELPQNSVCPSNASGLELCADGLSCVPSSSDQWMGVCL